MNILLIIAGCLAALSVLGMGLSCAVDDRDNLMVGWDDVEPSRRPLLGIAWLIVALYGLFLLLKKAVPKHQPDWLLYIRVMWLGGNLRTTTYGIELVLHQYQSRRRKPTRHPQWKRNMIARVMWLNHAKWPKANTPSF